jgi:hypothetical protein
LKQKRAWLVDDGLGVDVDVKLPVELTDGVPLADAVAEVLPLAVTETVPDVLAVTEGEGVPEPLGEPVTDAVADNEGV